MIYDFALDLTDLEGKTLHLPTLVKELSKDYAAKSGYNYPILKAVRLVVVKQLLSLTKESLDVIHIPLDLDVLTHSYGLPPTTNDIPSDSFEDTYVGMYSGHRDLALTVTLLAISGFDVQVSDYMDDSTLKIQLYVDAPLGSHIDLSFALRGEHLINATLSDEAINAWNQPLEDAWLLKRFKLVYETLLGNTYFTIKPYTFDNL